MFEISALVSSLSYLHEVAKSLLDLRDLKKLNSTVIELQKAIIEAQQQAIAMQQSYSALETKARDLEAECMRLKDWSAEKQNYTLRRITSGVFAYVEKEVVGEFKKAHKYCQKCFEDGQKSLFQESPGPKRARTLTCPRCGFTVDFYSYLA